MIAKESAEIYCNENIIELFNFFADIRENRIDGSKPFNISSPQDMASIQKTLGKGGDAGSKNYFCHCCSIKSEDRATPNTEKCEAYKEEGID